jgi:CheY-like chemotaxis protein
MITSQVTILLVEDDDIDAATVQRGLKSARITNPVIRAVDGVEALEHVHGTNGRNRVPQPFLLLVDLRLPRLDGLDLIRHIRSDRALQRTVIFVLTSSDSDRDQLAAYDQHVAGYIVKSGDSDQFMRLASMLDYYLLIVSPPPAGFAEQVPEY